MNALDREILNRLQSICSSLSGYGSKAANIRNNINTNIVSANLDNRDNENITLIGQVRKIAQQMDDISNTIRTSNEGGEEAIRELYRRK